MGGNDSLTQAEVKELVYRWFKKLTDHAPVSEMEEMLNGAGMVMKFPESSFNSMEGFRDWYQTVTNTYFDQVHEIKMLDAAISQDKAVVKLIVNWQARTWTPPDGYSKWTGVYAGQTWLVEKNSETGRPVISRYEVTEFEPMEGPLKI